CRVDCCWRFALVRYVRDIDAGRQREQAARHMIDFANATRTKGKLAGLGLGKLDKLFEAVDIQGRADAQITGSYPYTYERNKVVRTGRRIFIEQRLQKQGVGSIQNRIPVGRSVFGMLGTDHA